MDTENAIVQHLRGIRRTLDSRADDMREVKMRLGILAARHASLSSRIDRRDERVARIEKRLDLRDA